MEILQRQWRADGDDVTPSPDDGNSPATMARRWRRRHAVARRWKFSSDHGAQMVTTSRRRPTMEILQRHWRADGDDVTPSPDDGTSPATMARRWRRRHAVARRWEFSRGTPASRHPLRQHHHRSRPGAPSGEDQARLERDQGRTARFISSSERVFPALTSALASSINSRKTEFVLRDKDSSSTFFRGTKAATGLSSEIRRTISSSNSSAYSDSGFEAMEISILFIA